jgi:ubiquinone/menaquinone biosynthesis C-methylase UbiE
MQPETYYRLATREETYWWHRARRRLCRALLLKYGVQRGARWLDLGCGPGGNLRLLDGMGPDLIVGVDLSPIALKLAQSKTPAAALVRADIAACIPFADASFDAVTLLNVLYHRWIERDSEVLREVARVLRPGGIVLVTEPAFDVLARDMDRVGMAQRRYRRRDMAAMCRSAALDPLFAGYFTSFGFPILLGLKLAQRLVPYHRRETKALSADMRSLPPAANGALHILAALEAGLIALGVAVPFGTTLVCVARKL